jgi:hypothetical protein
MAENESIMRRARNAATGTHSKTRKVPNVTYQAVDSLLPEMQKKVDLAFDILFDAVLKETSLAPYTQASDSTKAPRPE